MSLESLTQTIQVKWAQEHRATLLCLVGFYNLTPPPQKKRHELYQYLKRLRPLCESCIYSMSQEEWTKLRESVPYVELYRYNPKHLYPKLNGYGDNGQRSLKL